MVTPPFSFTLDDISDAFVQEIQAGLYQPKTYSPEAVAIWKEIGARSDNKWASDSREEPPEGFENNEHLYEQDFMNDLISNRDIIFAAYGTEDRLFDQTQIGNIAKNIPYQHTAAIPGAADYSFIDQRTTFIVIVNTFFSLSAGKSTH